MYTIGQISKLVNISPNALRYYDEISLLKPSEQDKFSRYRYYTKEQVKDLLLIQEYKYYGFSLNEIRMLLKQDEKALIPLLDKKVNELLKTHEDDKMRIKIIMRKLKTLYLRDNMIMEDEFNMKNKLNMEDKLNMINEHNITKFDMNNKQELKTELKEKTILLVEDVAFERMLIKEILASHGYTNIYECTNGKEAVETYDKVIPDLVITGITMPIMDGLYAMKLIREKHADAKAIFCSYMSQLFILPIAIKTNTCFDFIPKPIKTERFISSVIKALDLSHVTLINDKMDSLLVDMIEQNINNNKNDFIGTYRLDQKETDSFFDIVSIDEYNRFYEDLESKHTRFIEKIENDKTENQKTDSEKADNEKADNKKVDNEKVDNEKLDNQKTDYNVSHLIKSAKKDVDFNEAGFHIALQKEVNRQLTHKLSECIIIDNTVDFVHPNVINDYVINNDTTKIPLISNNECIGGLSYPQGVKLNIDEFISSFLELQNKAIKNRYIKTNHEVKSFNVQTECILSTFLDEEDNKITVFIKNEAYE